MTAFASGSLFPSLAELPDPRSPHGRRFALGALLAAACAAVLCGQASYAAIAQWTRNQPPELLRALGFFRKPPTDGAFPSLFTLPALALFPKPPPRRPLRYLFPLLGLTAFEAALAAWVARLIPVTPEQLRPT